MAFYSPGVYDPGFRLVDGSLQNATEGNPKVTTEDQIVATGTTVANARPLLATVNSILTTTPGTGVLLPKALPGLMIYVFNRGASSLTVYAQLGETIDLGALSVPLAATGRCSYICATPGQWLSAQLGALSA